MYTDSQVIVFFLYFRPGAQNKNTRVAPPPTSASPGRPLTAKEQREQRMKELVKQFEEATEELRPIRLGDASIASPFTSRDSSITCSKGTPVIKTVQGDPCNHNPVLFKK